MAAMKRILTLCFSILLALFLCITPTSAKEEAVPYIISSLNVNIKIQDNGLMKVEENIDVSNCEDLLLTRLLPTTYRWKQDETSVEQTYDIKNIEVSGHDFTMEAIGTVSKIDIILAKKTESITLRYDVQLKDFQLPQQQLLYYTLFTGFQGSILSFHAEIQFPSVFPANSQLLNEEDKLLSNYQVITQDNTMTIQSQGSIPFGSQVSLQASLPQGYFDFGTSFDMTLLATLVSVLLVCGSFIVYMSKEKTKNKKKMFLFHPPKNIPIILYGYIMDGYISEKDFLPLLIEWANRGYVWIEESDQDVHILLRRELPVTAPSYEKLFFDAIFGNKTIVNLYDLENKDFTIIFEELKEIVFDHLCSGSHKSIYHMNNTYHQIIFCLLVGVPLFLAMFSTYYMENYQMLSSLWPALLTWAFISLSCIPWAVLVRKYQVLSDKTRKSMFAILAIVQSILLFIIGYILLRHHMNFLYIIITILMTIFFMLDLFILDRRTKKGSQYYYRVKALDNFIHQSRVAQIDELIYKEPNYFYYMLPYAAALDVVQMWSGKFAALMIQKPFWFMTPQASAQQMYWVEPLVYALEDIGTAILRVPSQSKPY